ncbi:hypothetical protein Cadr_000031276, partial [Camelus dromedarius]
MQHKDKELRVIKRGGAIQLLCTWGFLKALAKRQSVMVTRPTTLRRDAHVSGPAERGEEIKVNIVLWAAGASGLRGEMETRSALALTFPDSTRRSWALQQEALSRGWSSGSRKGRGGQPQGHRAGKAGWGTRAAAPLGGQPQPQPPAPVRVRRPRPPGHSPPRGGDGSASEERNRGRRGLAGGRGEGVASSGLCGARLGREAVGAHLALDSCGWGAGEGPSNSAEHTLTCALAGFDTRTALPQPPDPFPGSHPTCTSTARGPGLGQEPKAYRATELRRLWGRFPAWSWSFQPAVQLAPTAHAQEGQRSSLGSVIEAGTSREGEDGRRRRGGE